MFTYFKTSSCLKVGILLPKNGRYIIRRKNEKNILHFDGTIYCGLFLTLRVPKHDQFIANFCKGPFFPEFSMLQPNKGPISTLEP